MQIIVEKKLCTGCHACFNACPKNCIKMEPDEEGFLYPDIDANKCIDCGKCKKICPILNDYSGNPKGEAFAYINKDEETRMNSSSGGIFTLLAEFIIDSGGIVFGAAFDTDLNVHHISIDNKNELYKLRGSKYLQSTIGNSYKDAEKYLKLGQYVLFSGTPCQISGLKTYLGVDYPNLITQDIICHGVPSPLVWQKYLMFLKSKFKATINQKNPPVFRNKSTGWKEYSVSVDFENNATYKKKSSEDLYMKAFLKNLSLRHSCYNCNFKSLKRESDITLADFWGIDKIKPELDDNKGVSLILINTKKGKNLLNSISQKTKMQNVNIEEAIKYNTAAVSSPPIPKNRDKFIHYVICYNFKKAVNKALDEKLYRKLINKLKQIIKGVINHVQK